MPVIKSAIKKLRRDRKREKENDEFKKSLDRALRVAKKQKTAKAVSEAASTIDKAVKKNVIHKNRAARIKASLSKLAKPQTAKSKSPEKATTNKDVKKPVAKKAKSAKKTK